MRKILLPWHWKRTVSAALDARVACVIAAINDLKADISALSAHINNLGTQVDARLAQHAQELSELREESYTIRHTLSTQLDDASWHKLKSSAWDIQRGLAAVKNEIAAQLGFSLHDMANQTADQRLWLQQINDELAALRTKLGELYRLGPGTSLPDQSGETTNRDASLATPTSKFGDDQDVNVDQSAISEDSIRNNDFDLESRIAGTR